MKKNNYTKKIVYIIPTYNEKENIVSMLKLVHNTLVKFRKYNFNILVVDDNSPDGTGKLVKELGGKKTEIRLLSGQKDGLGKAMIRGYNYAVKKLKADVVISNEADFSYNPRGVGLMVKKIEEGYDFVLGSRRLENTNRWPPGRRIVHFVANTLCAKVIAGVTEVDDHNSAFKAIRVKGVLDRIKFDKFPKGFAFFNFFTFRVTQITTKIYEFKTVFKPRTKGVSKIEFGPNFLKNMIEYIVSCFKIRLEKTFHR